MKKQFLQSAKIIILGFILAVSASYVMGAWTPPPTNPPDGNTPAPINVGTTPQIRAGEFWVITTYPAPTINTACVGSCPFDGGIFSAVNSSHDGLIVNRYGGTSTNGLVSFNNTLVSNGYLRVQNLNHTTVTPPTSSTIATDMPTPICADKNGKFVLCPVPPPTPGLVKVCVVYGEYFNNSTPFYTPPISYHYNSANANTSSISACFDWAVNNFRYGSNNLPPLLSLGCVAPDKVSNIPSPSISAVSYVNMGGLFPRSEYLNPTSLTLPNPNCGW